MSDLGTTTATSLREHAAEEVRALLGRRRMSATELARKMGVSQAYVWRRLSGETAFDLDDLDKISALLNVEVLALLPRRGYAVAIDGSSDRQTTVAKKTLANQPHPFIHSQHGTPRSAIRRPVFLHQ